MTTTAPFTALRALNPEILRAFNGREVTRGESAATVRFRTLGHATAWAEATGQTGNTFVQTPNTDMSLDTVVRVRVDLDN